MTGTLDTLKKLLPIYGPSGREGLVADAITELAKPFADEISRDALGNLVVYKKGGGRKVMLAAHMDQIGYMVTHIDENGFLRVSQVGAVGQVMSLYFPVRFENGTTGIVGYETKAEGYDKLKHENLFVDIGARSRKQAEEAVRVGDMAVFDSHVTQGFKRLSSGAMDDRIGCAVLIEALRQVKNSPWDIYAVFTVQEETGSQGAIAAAYSIAPEMGLAVDITPSPDTPDSVKLCSAELGRGPAIKVRDRSLIAHPRVRRWLEDAAQARGIACQYEVLNVGGTDAGVIQTSRSGVASGVLSIPTRFWHTPSETIDTDDYEASISLLAQALSQEA